MWTGYLDAPQNGFYNLTIATDASAALAIDGSPIELAPTQNGTIWRNQSPILLTAGGLTGFKLTVKSATNVVSVSWSSLGLGWQIIPGAYLYSATLVERLRSTYTRFLKVVTLANLLSLTANEMAYLGTGTSLRVNSNIGQGWFNFLRVSPNEPDLDTAARLSEVLTPLLGFAGIKRSLSPKDERLLMVLQNPGATLANGRSALLSLTGWDQNALNTLLSRFQIQQSELSSIDNFRRVYDAYAFVRTSRIPTAVLIAAATNAPTAAVAAAFQSALRVLYAEPDWVTAVRPINNTMRVRQRDALAAYILQQLGDAYAQTLITVATASDADIGATSLSFADTAGIARGMLVQGANIVPNTVVTAVEATAVAISSGIMGHLLTGSCVTFIPGTAPDINTAEKLFEYFLIDAETQPTVETSRIRLALSSVQLFVERILRNLEPLCYWLYPELRGDQSPFFKQMMTSLLQGDITNDAAVSCYLDYLTNLETVAKLEPCGIYYVPASSDANEIAYVVARSAGAHRKYYFRTLKDGRWAPWDEVKIDCEDMPITPIVWDGRLFLFWLKVLKQGPTQPQAPFLGSGTLSNADCSELQSSATTALQPEKNRLIVGAALCWSEFYNGKWQATKTSDINRPTTIGPFDAIGSKSFDPDRCLFRIERRQCSGDLADALVLEITSPIYDYEPSGGFILYNTHSLPVRFEDTASAIISELAITRGLGLTRSLMPTLPCTGGQPSQADDHTFTIRYAYSAFLQDRRLFEFPLVPFYVEAQSDLDSWSLPFFYEDRRNVFYVTTTPAYRLISDSNGFGIINMPGSQDPHITIPPSVHQKRPRPPDRGDRVFISSTPIGGDLTAMQSYVDRSRYIRTGLGSSLAFSYQERQFHASGSVASKPRER
jgi:hypothetical protein